MPLLSTLNLYMGNNRGESHVGACSEHISTSATLGTAVCLTLIEQREKDPAKNESPDVQPWASKNRRRGDYASGSSFLGNGGVTLLLCQCKNRIPANVHSLKKNFFLICGKYVFLPWSPRCSAPRSPHSSLLKHCLTPISSPHCIVFPAPTADQMVLFMYLFVCLLPIFCLLECKFRGNWGIPCAGLC